MAKKKKENPALVSNIAPVNNPSKNIFALTNRGFLLDVFVFLLNLFLMRILTERFIALTDDAGNGDPFAGIALLVFCIGIFVLPAAGATFKRWRFQQRMQAREGKTVPKSSSDLSGKDMVSGCLFNPIIYFALNLIIFVFITVYATQFVYGGRTSNSVSGAITVFGVIITIVQTILIYRYFSPPKKEPVIAFLKSPLSEHLGDICIFLYMTCFQIVWNWLILQIGWKATGIGDFFTRLAFLFCLALLVYFPPRVFYLAEDIFRRRTWLMIFLAQLPVIVRMFVG